jgi:hypothetical protein
MQAVDIFFPGLTGNIHAFNGITILATAYKRE